MSAISSSVDQAIDLPPLTLKLERQEAVINNTTQCASVIMKAERSRTKSKPKQIVARVVPPKASFPPRKIFKHSGAYFTFGLYATSRDYEKAWRSLKAIRQLLVEAGVPAISISIGKKRSSLEQAKIELTLSTKLHWRKIRALCERDPKLAQFFPYQSISSFREPLRNSNEISLLLPAFLKEAEIAIYSHPSKQHPVDWSPSEVISYEHMLSSVFDRFQGLCLGEMHTHESSKQFLIDQMAHLKKCGVTTLFLEHLMYDTMQPFLDEYYASSDITPMPLPLKAYLEYLDRGFDLDQESSGFTLLVYAAKKAGIRVVGIDTSLSYECGWNSMGRPNGYERYLGMNYVASEIIRHEAGKDKYVALMGNTHGSTVHSLADPLEHQKVIRLQKTAPGVAEILEIPFIVFEDNIDKPVIEKSVANYKGQIHFVHMVIKGYQKDAPLQKAAKEHKKGYK